MVTQNTQDPQDPNEDEVINKIYMSYDYDKFVLSPFNRDVKQERKDRMTIALTKRNLTIDEPLTVKKDPETGKLVIIEGQGRYLVNRELKEPIYYKFALKMTIDDVGKIGELESGGRWFPDDHMKVWCTRGYPAYITLRDFCAQFPWLNIHTAITLIGTGNLGGKKFKKSFSEGAFSAGNLMRGLAMAEMIQDFRRFVPVIFRSHMFISVMRVVMQDPAYSHKRMMEKMEKFGYLLTKQGRNDAYYDLINEIYNKNAREATRHEFGSKIKRKTRR